MGLVTAGALWLFRIVARTARALVPVVQDIRDFAQEWRDAMSVREEVTANTRDLGRLLVVVGRIEAAIGVPGPGQGQQPLVPYVHDSIHALRNEVTKIVLVSGQLAKTAVKTDAAAQHLDDITGRLEP